MASNDQTYQQQPASNRSATMNDLPNELLPLIFRHLKIRDLGRCRMVCHRFKLFCDEVKLEELIITNKVRNHKEYWFYTNEKLNFADGIDFDTFTLVRSQFRFNQLKRLYFNGSYEDYQLLRLYDFTQLEQLTISCSRLVEEKRIVEINLPNLKVLHDRRFAEHFDLRLNTPNLEFLKSESNGFMTIHHPNSIKHLERDYCINESLNLLKNIEYLKCNLEWLRRPDDVLSTYSKLKTLLCNENASFLNIDSLNALRQIVNLRPDLAIYFQSVKLDNVEKIDEYDPANHLAFQINNYDLLCDDIFYLDRFDYNKLMGLVNGALPDDFYRKYFNIRSVEVSDNVHSEAHFVEFLKRLEYLRYLSLDHATFSQIFYDSLPETHQISYLILGEGVGPISNYDFLHKMNHLERLQMHGQDSVEFFDLKLALFSRLKHFREILFQFTEGAFKVYRTSSNYTYIVTTSTRPKASTSGMVRSFDQLVEVLTTHKNARLESKQN